MTVTHGTTGSNIGSTDYCLTVGLEGYIAAAGIIPLINDTLVFLAISIRLMTNTPWKYTLKDGVRTLVFGDYLPSFSRAFLQDGQIYYLTTVTTNLLTVIMFYVIILPATYRSLLNLPNVVTMNIMACRVFRNTKFGLLKQDEYGVSTGIRFSSREVEVASSVISLSLTGIQGPKNEDDLIASNRNTDVINIRGTVEHPASDSPARYPPHIQEPV